MAALGLTALSMPPSRLYWQVQKWVKKVGAYASEVLRNWDGHEVCLTVLGLALEDDVKDSFPLCCVGQGKRQQHREPVAEWILWLN